MKQSRNETVKSLISSYLKRRHYTENDNLKKLDQPLVRSREATALSNIIDMESSCPNGITYKCVQNDPAVSEAQFGSLVNWINDLKFKKTSEELKALLFPMLCHHYIEMLNGGHHKEATTFLRKYQQLSSEEGVELLEELCSVDATKAITEERVVSCLRSSIYQATLSSKSIQILKQYLINKSHVLILHIINTWFDLEETPPTDEIFLDLGYESSPSQDDNKKVSGDSVDVAKIGEIIRIVKDAPSSPAPLLMYSVENANEDLACGKISSDSSFLAVGYTTSAICIWSLTGEALPQRMPKTSSRICMAADYIFENDDDAQDVNLCRMENSVELLGHTGVVHDTAFVPASDLMVSVSNDSTMRVWNYRTNECLSLYRGHAYPIFCVEASPLNSYVATGSYDRTARLWSLELNFPLRIFAGHFQDVDCLRFHPNGNYLATGSSDNSIRLWSVDSGELVRVFEGHRGGVMALAFNPSGNQLASAGEDKRIRVWDVRNSGILGEFRGFSDTIVSLDWSYNADFLAACCMDNTVKICPLKNILNDDEPSRTKFYQVAGNAMCSVRYSLQNTPMCVVGNPKRLQRNEESFPVNN